MASNKKRVICFVITSFVHYSRNFLILEELKRMKGVELHIVIGGAAVVPKYTSSETQVKDLLIKGGFKNVHELFFNLEGDSLVVKSKATGLGIIEFSTLFADLRPDLVVVRGDRFEVLAATIAAAYMNITVAHIEGGDVSGTIDESVRHTITKLSHIHFVTNKSSHDRVIKMGENKKYIFNFGSPDIDAVKKMLKYATGINADKFGSGAEIDLKKDFVVVMYHPVVSELDKLRDYTRTLINAVHGLGHQTIWFWPNFDAGAEIISHELRSFNDRVNDHKIKFLRYVHPKYFIGIINKARCFVGNSSAGIKECSFLGIPVVNVGSRQKGRFRAKNVIDVDYSDHDIIDAIKMQMSHGNYDLDRSYYAENASKNIAKTLSTVQLYTQKSFNDN